MELGFQEIIDFDESDEIKELHKLNSELTEEERNILNTAHDWVLEGCSDSRFIKKSVSRDGKAFTKYNAGNQFDPEDALHPELDIYVIIGHEKEDDAGCGACNEAGKLAEADDSAKNALKQELPDLYNVAEGATGSIKENLEAAIKSKKDYAKEQGRDIKVIGGIYNHVTGELSEFLGDKDTETEDLIKRIVTDNKEYLKEHSPEVEAHGEKFHLSHGQNPKFIVYNSTGHDFFEYFGKDSELSKPNMVFEGSQFGSDISSLAKGSLDYAWEHGLKDHDFKNSKDTFLLVNSETELQGVMDKIKEDKAFHGYIERGGKAYAAIPGQDQKIKFYSITAK